MYPRLYPKVRNAPNLSSSHLYFANRFDCSKSVTNVTSLLRDMYYNEIANHLQ